MKKKIRIIVAIFLYPLSAPFLGLAASLFGIGTLMGFMVCIAYPLFWLGDNKEMMAEFKESFMMFSAFLWFPILFWIEYAKTGKLNYGEG